MKVIPPSPPLPFPRLEVPCGLEALSDPEMNLSGTNFGELRRSVHRSLSERASTKLRPFTSDRTYRITPIQHPERSGAFDGAYLSRLPLAPPLILQLDCWDADGALTIPYAFQQNLTSSADISQLRRATLPRLPPVTPDARRGGCDDGDGPGRRGRFHALRDPCNHPCRDAGPGRRTGDLFRLPRREREIRRTFQVAGEPLADHGVSLVGRILWERER